MPNDKTTSACQISKHFFKETLIRTKKRMRGMCELVARARRGLNWKLPDFCAKDSGAQEEKEEHATNDDGSDCSEDNDEKDGTFVENIDCELDFGNSDEEDSDDGSDCSENDDEKHGKLIGKNDSKLDFGCSDEEDSENDSDHS